LVSISKHILSMKTPSAFIAAATIPHVYCVGNNQSVTDYADCIGPMLGAGVCRRAVSVAADESVIALDCRELLTCPGN
ncbi:MAG: hypothetical protein K2I58_05480, partial [Candidatus Amulumruptor sp.]|nr:hypothetical protein [Candidatus Amulumruptor sp.]